VRQTRGRICHYEFEYRFTSLAIFNILKAKIQDEFMFSGSQLSVVQSKPFLETSVVSWLINSKTKNWTCDEHQWRDYLANGIKWRG
jgi:hypothetical protein